MRQPPFRATVLALLLVLAGCASPPNDPRDPFESLNREVNSVNRALDQAALKPAAKAYEHSLPGLVRAGVSNFFANLGDPWSAVNSLLQLKVANAAQDTMRFAVNTFFGLGGLLDIATDAGIERHKQDFGTRAGLTPPASASVLEHRKRLDLVKGGAPQDDGVLGPGPAESCSPRHPAVTRGSQQSLLATASLFFYQFVKSMPVDFIDQIHFRFQPLESNGLFRCLQVTAGLLAHTLIPIAMSFGLARHELARVLRGRRPPFRISKSKRPTKSW